MVRHRVIAPSILVEPQFCSPCCQLQSRQASSAKSGVALADLVAPQNLHRPIHLSYSLLYSMVCLFSILNTLLTTNEHSAQISMIFEALTHFVKNGSQWLAQFVGQGNTQILLGLRFHQYLELLCVGLLLGQLRYWSSNVHVRQWFRLQIPNVLPLAQSSAGSHL